MSVLREHRAGDAAVLTQLRGDVSELTAAVVKLTAMLNRARGAMWLLGIVGAGAEAMRWLWDAVLRARG